MVPTPWHPKCRFLFWLEVSFLRINDHHIIICIAKRNKVVWGAHHVWNSPFLPKQSGVGAVGMSPLWGVVQCHLRRDVFPKSVTLWQDLTSAPNTSTLTPSAILLMGLHHPTGPLPTEPSSGSACVCSPAPSSQLACRVQDTGGMNLCLSLLFTQTLRLWLVHPDLAEQCPHLWLLCAALPPSTLTLPSFTPLPTKLHHYPCCVENRNNNVSKSHSHLPPPPDLL